MIELIVNFKADNTISIMCRYLYRNKQKYIYNGNFLAWDISPVLKRYGKCVKVAYAGSKIMSINKINDSLLIKHIMCAETFLWNDAQSDDETMLFISNDEIMNIRSCLFKHGVVILQELLYESPENVRFPDLTIRSLNDEKLHQYILYKIRRLLPFILIMVLLFYVLSHSVSKSIEVENAEMYGMILKSKRESGQNDIKLRMIDRLRSKMALPIYTDAIYAFDSAVLAIPKDIKLTSMTISENVMMLDGILESSESLAETMSIVSQSDYIKDIEVSRIDTDSKGNRVFTLKLWLC